jgi:hypothetical protein
MKKITTIKQFIEFVINKGEKTMDDGSCLIIFTSAWAFLSVLTNGIVLYSKSMSGN